MSPLTMGIYLYLFLYNIRKEGALENTILQLFVFFCRITSFGVNCVQNLLFVTKLYHGTMMMYLLQTEFLI